MHQWHMLTSEAVLQQLDTNIEIGLSTLEADDRLAKYGPNALTERQTERPWQIFWQQLTDTMMVILNVWFAVSRDLLLRQLNRQRLK